jgi:hypothetical protein
MSVARKDGKAVAGHQDRSFGWETRLVLASPVNLFWTGAVLAFLVYASFLLCAAWNHVPVVIERDGDPALSSDAWTALCMALLWWSIVSIGQYTRKANFADARKLSHLGLAISTERLAELERGPTSAASRRALFFGLIGALGGMVFYTQVYQPNGHRIHLTTVTVTSIWFFLMTVALFGQIFRSLSYLRADTSVFVRDLDHRISVDLLDISKLDGFGRIALRGALPWLVSGTIVLLLLLGQQSTELFWPLIAGLVSSATGVFAWPMWRVHRLIDHAKKVELARLRREIVEMRAAFEKPGPESDRAAPRLSALLALEARVEHAREWPLDMPTVFRFALYLALPLGSWLGGAIVERILGLVMG